MRVPFADPFSHLEQLSSVDPIVGRQAEQRLLSTLLDTIEGDLPTGPRALTLSSEMGVGKSYLLAALARDAQARGFLVLQASASEATSIIPYHPFVEALRPVLLSASSEQLRVYTGLTTAKDEDLPFEGAGTWSLSAQSLLFPELAALLQMQPSQSAEPLSPEQQKFRLFDALALFLERLALEQSVLFVIDNLQWADSASLELMMYLIVRLRKRQLALVAATRPPGRQAEHQESAAANAAAKALQELVQRDMLLYLPLAPMDAQAAQEHLRSLLPGSIPDAIEQVLLKRSEGNPFFLEELVRLLLRAGQLKLQEGRWQARGDNVVHLPDSILLLVERRIQELSERCQDFLQCAALSGRSFPTEVLTLVYEDEGGEDITKLIAEAEQALLIAPLLLMQPDVFTTYGTARGNLQAVPEHRTVTAPYYTFCQGIVQEVLQRTLPVQRRRHLHRRIGCALETFYSYDAGLHAAELAQHYLAGGEPEAALRWSFRAGENALRQQAYREALNFFGQALTLLQSGHAHTVPSQDQLPTQAELSLIIGELWFKLGELNQAELALQQALTSFRASTAPVVQLARANRRLADLYRMQARYDQAFAHLQAASAALDTIVEGENEPTGDRMQRLPWLQSRPFAEGNTDLRFEHASERIQLLQARALLAMLLNHEAEVEAALWRSHQLASVVFDRESQAFALHLLGWIRGWGEDIHEAIRLLKQANELYLALADPFRATLSDQVLGVISLALGDIEQAVLFTQRGIERARRYGVRRVSGWLYWNQSVIALFQNNWEQCESHLQQAQQELFAGEDQRLQAAIFQVQAEYQFRLGDWSAAEESFKSAKHHAVNTEWQFGTMALYSHFLAVTGRHSQARRELEQSVTQREPIGLVGHFYNPFLAECYLHLDDAEAAATYIERLHRLRGFMYYGTSVDRVLGVVATRVRDWETAEQAFEASLAFCRRVQNRAEEATVLYEQARAALMRNAPLEQVYVLCSQARTLFLDCNMQRAVAMVDQLRDGASLLKERSMVVSPSVPTTETTKRTVQAGYELLQAVLTPRELEVLRLVAEGHTDREVAETLYISPRTVNRHLSNIFVKLEVSSRAAAVAFAIRQGFV